VKALFKGVHPPGFKDLSGDQVITPLPVCDGDEFYLALNQHIGVPCVPIVKKGQAVLKGDPIAEPSGNFSAALHSPVDGEVTGVGRCDYPIYGSADAVIIKAGAQQNNYSKVEGFTDISECALKGGIVGMGGAMFPSHIKLAPQDPVDTVIINGAECEPYLTCDYRLMIERADELAEAVNLIKKHIGATRAVIGVEANKPEAIAALRKVAGDIEVLELPTVYPQGGEKQLILSTTGRVVPEGKLPASVGVLVHNVGTALAIRDAYIDGMPLIHRVVTVTGDVVKPMNVLAPLGTPVRRLIEFAGGVKGEFKKLIFGGPMTGISVHSLDIPVYKGMNGLVAVCTDEAAKVRPCIRCGKCIKVCPMNLSPVMLEKLALRKKHAELAEYRLMSCIECGACNYICPSARPLKNLFRLEKTAVSAVIRGDCNVR